MSKIMDKKKYSACIKNITDEVLRTSKQYAKLIGTEPEISKSEEKRLTLDKEEPKTFYGLL
jgi:hypothetical protein